MSILPFFNIFRQESQVKTALLDLLNGVIVKDETLSRDLTSHETWSDSNGHNASLKDITVELENAITEVRTPSFMVNNGRN